MSQQQESNLLLTNLQRDLSLEISDAHNQGDRAGAAVLQRVVNAIQRGLNRSAAAEQAKEA